MNILLRRNLSVRPLRNLPANKRLINFCLIPFIQILDLCTQKSVCATNLGPFGKIVANFPVQLSSRSQFANIENRTIIAENQGEKHKNKSLVTEQCGSRKFCQRRSNFDNAFFLLLRPIYLKLINLCMNCVYNREF